LAPVIDIKSFIQMTWFELGMIISKQITFFKLKLVPLELKQEDSLNKNTKILSLKFHFLIHQFFQVQ